MRVAFYLFLNNFFFFLSARRPETKCEAGCFADYIPGETLVDLIDDLIVDLIVNLIVDLIVDSIVDLIVDSIVDLIVDLIAISSSI